MCLIGVGGQLVIVRHLVSIIFNQSPLQYKIIKSHTQFPLNIFFKLLWHVSRKNQQLFEFRYTIFFP